MNVLQKQQTIARRKKTFNTKTTSICMKLAAFSLFGGWQRIKPDGSGSILMLFTKRLFFLDYA